jgi:hypothetical protein
MAPQFGGLGLYARLAGWNSKLQRLAYQRGDEDGPTAAMEVLLGLSSLHVMVEAEAQGSTNSCAASTGNVNPQISAMLDSLRTWNINPF